MCSDFYVLVLRILSPMNPLDVTKRKDLDGDLFGVKNLLINLATYSLVGVIGTFISLATMIFPYPLLYVSFSTWI